MGARSQSGTLISFDGVDCSGKETQVGKLVRRLQKLGHIVLEMSSPDYDTPTGQELYRLLHDQNGIWQSMSWEEKMRLFAANRAEHQEEIVAALKRGDVVIYDRYVPSSVTFMAIEALSAQEIDLYRSKIYQAVEKEEYIHHEIPKEDASIFLDVPPAVTEVLLAERKKKRKDTAEYTDNLEVQRRLYNEYDWICRKRRSRFVRVPCVVDGQLLSIDEVAELVWRSLVKKFPYLERHG